MSSKKSQGASSFAGPKIKLDTAVAADKIGADGVSYTVQAKRTKTAPWTTLAAGSRTPNVTFDVNQFPGSKSVTVRS